MPVLTLQRFCEKCNENEDDLEKLRELADYLTVYRLIYKGYQRQFMAEHLLDKIETAKGVEFIELINLP